MLEEADEFTWCEGGRRLRGCTTVGRFQTQASRSACYQMHHDNEFRIDQPTNCDSTQNRQEYIVDLVMLTLLQHDIHVTDDVLICPLDINNWTTNFEGLIARERYLGDSDLRACTEGRVANIAFLLHV